MIVEHIPCGPFANESEQLALEILRNRLQAKSETGTWILLSNVAFSVTHQAQSDEIDLVAIGPTGVFVIEVKHWGPQWLKANTTNGHLDSSPAIQAEADRAISKARKVGTTLRKVVSHLPHVPAILMTTWKASEVRNYRGQIVRGVRLLCLEDWTAALGLDIPSSTERILTERDIRNLSRVLEPRTAVNLDGSLRRFGGFVNLELHTARDNRFHRVYRGIRAMQQDRIELHLYDLSALDNRNAEQIARREYEALHRMQSFRWAPRILDSFQEATGYVGEMFFFSIVDPASPSLSERKKDSGWGTRERVTFARAALNALQEMHATGASAPNGEGLQFLHRNLTTATVRVRHDNSPLFTGFHLARIPSDISVASSVTLSKEHETTAAPEVRTGGVTAADQRSDVYAICAALCCLFEGQQQPDADAVETLKILSGGMAEAPSERMSLMELASSLANLLGESVPSPAAPPAKFWSEEQVVPFRDRDYRVVARLGSGGVGTTFKVVELDHATKEDLGTYVAKVAHDETCGLRVLASYRLVRSHLGRHFGLSGVYEVAKKWRENEFVALMTWVEGAALGDFIGVFPLLAEDLQEPHPEALALRWFREVCQGLDVLHKSGLIHGDVSPRNLIVSDASLVLTDYDFVTKIEDAVSAPGTMMYCSPSYQHHSQATPSDDLFALAASLFHVVFAKDPFLYNGVRAKERGLNWEGLHREDCPVLAPLLDRATSHDPEGRFKSVAEVLAVLCEGNVPPGPPEEATHVGPIGADTADVGPVAPSEQLREQEIEWLHSLLQSYPGSRWGNQETRGLDTAFAAETYVETGLEEALLQAIRTRSARLIILCGNAGDGKTALLQHLAERLGFGKHLSAERILEHRCDDGLTVRMNLDGSAAWKGRSADEILDEFLAPFQHGAPADDVTHLLAINDGRLLEWIAGVEGRLNDATALVEDLCAFLQDQDLPSESQIRFINLNERSLVGGITPDGQQIQGLFVEQLIDHLYGGDRAGEIWHPCLSCSAKSRCEVYRAMRLFGPTAVPERDTEDICRRARQRLVEALQAVHLRGEVHITARELRAALAFILFGVHWCKDYHDVSEESPRPYWDRAFDWAALGRQGEVLLELTRLDPALEAHPQIDRHLLYDEMLNNGPAAPSYGSDIPLSSARRRAYFEWTEQHLEAVARDVSALGLAGGRHLQQFRELALDGLNNAVERRTATCQKICKGVSRLEDLPPQALSRTGVVPLRITPRTPTESAFWVEKPLQAFDIQANLPRPVDGIDRLHRQALLVYRYRDGSAEVLAMGAQLFHVLLELAEGFQLGDVSSDEVFTRLAIFVQRMAREDHRELMAWNPMQDQSVFRVSVALHEGPDGIAQSLTMQPVPSPEVECP